MRIRPIRNDRDHASALERIDALWGAEPRSARGDELEVLVTLVDAYEREHHPIEAPTPIAAIAFRMEQQGLTRKDLYSLIGSRARVSEVLSGKRSLSLSMIRRLRSGLGLSADLLIGPGTEPRTRPTRARRLRSGPIRASG